MAGVALGSSGQLVGYQHMWGAFIDLIHSFIH